MTALKPSWPMISTLAHDINPCLESNMENIGTTIYSGFKLCESLIPSVKCFYVHKYSEGKFFQILHEHIPKYIISRASSEETLRTIIAQHSEWDASRILSSFLNKRGKNPVAQKAFIVNIEYPEPGVFRFHINSGNIGGWFDEVVIPTDFRKTH